MNMASRSDAESPVKGPAISFIVLGAIGAAMQVIGALMKVLGLGMSAGDMSQLEGLLGPGALEFMNLLNSTAVAVASTALGLAAAVVLVFGGLKMLKLESYGLAIAAAVVAMIPCLSPCCCIGLPFGIWGLVILFKDDVKSCFT